jgi:hypothetical protein
MNVKNTPCFEYGSRFEVIDVGDIRQFWLLDLDIEDLKLIIIDLSFPTELNDLRL